MSQSANNATFTVIWLGWDGRETFRQIVVKRDVDAAIKYACNQLKSGKGCAHDAHGFMVRREVIRFVP